MSIWQGIRSSGRVWLVATLASCLGVGCLVGSLVGLYNAIQRDYVQPSTVVVLLYSVKSQVNTLVVGALGVAIVAALLAVACYGLLKVLRCPPGRVDIGAGVWMLVVFACLVVGYALNKTRWYPHFRSLEGFLSNVLVAGIFFLLGLACWYWLLKKRQAFEGLLRWFGRVMNLRVVGVLGLYWLLLNVGFYAVNAQAAPQVQAAPQNRMRVVILGVDGATWTVMRPLLQAGKLPHIKQLMDAGAHGAFQSMEPTLSPVIWTTIATGKPMSEHGITHFVTDQWDQSGKLLTSNLRRVKALWNILSEHKRSVGVVGWFVTWPAERVNGFMVSSYAGIGRAWKGRLRHDIPQQTYPEDLMQDIEPFMEEAEEHLNRRFHDIFDRLDMSRLNETQRRVVEDTRDVLLADMLNANVGLHLYEAQHPDFFALYLGGTDVAGHRFWKYLYPKALAFNVSPEQVAMLGDVLVNYYLYIDQVVGRVMAAVDPNTLIMLISDHGMEAYIPRDGNDDRTSGQHGDAPPGVIILSGQGVRQGPLRVPASVYDVAPTVLYAMGLPLAQDMTGRPMLGAFTDGFLQQHPLAYIRSYETGSQAPGKGVARESDVDELLKKRLKSLGYIN
jgi:predicted AlkP superfamily phosphohydrolase/phosphomutase